MEDGRENCESFGAMHYFVPDMRFDGTRCQVLSLVSLLDILDDFY